MQRRLVIWLCIYMLVALLGGALYSLANSDKGRFSNAWESTPQARAEPADRDLLGILISVWGKSDVDISVPRSNEAGSGSLVTRDQLGKIPGGAGENADPATLNGIRPDGLRVTDGYSPDTVVSEDQMKAIEKRVSIADRMAALKIVKQRLTASDLKRIISMAANGITADEKRQIMEILKSRLLPEEFGEIRLIFFKYAVD
jgi:hypothetical protein